MERVDRHNYIGAYQAYDIFEGRNLAKWWDYYKNGIDNTEVTEPMKRGLYFENAIKKWWEDDNCQTIDDYGYVRHPKYDFIGGSPDGIIGNDTLVEIKSVGVYNKNWKDGNLPMQVICQANWYMNLAKVNKTIVIAYIEGTGLKTYEVLLDKRLADDMIKSAVEFWKRYVKGDDVPDDLDNSFEVWNNAEANNETYKEAEMDDIVLINKISSLKTQLKEVESELDLAEKTLKSWIGDNHGISSNGKMLVSYKAYPVYDYKSAVETFGFDTTENILKYSKIDYKAIAEAEKLKNVPVSNYYRRFIIKK